MRVCAASLHPRILSGQIDSLVGLGRALKRRGHEVTLLAPFDATGLLDQWLITLGEKPPSLASAAFRMLRAVPRIVAASRDADILHLALPTPAFGWVADVVQALSPVPVAAVFEGHLASAGQLLRPERLRQSWRTYLPLWGVNNGLFGRLSLHSCPAYLVSSEHQRVELAELGFPGERIRVIPNIVEFSKLAVCEPAAARAKLGLPTARRIVGYIGHFNDVKGVDLLAAAFASLAQNDADAHLALAWSGQGDPAPIRRRLAELKSRVTWLGKVHVGSFLCAVDVLALPYRSTAGQGAFPSLVLEALQAGCPLVTSDLPVIREIVRPRLSALLFEPESASALGMQLARVLSDERLRTTIAAAQRSVVRQRFASELLAARYEELYESLMPASAAVALEQAV